MIVNIAIEREVPIDPNEIINQWNLSDEYKKIAKIEMENNAIDKQSDVFNSDTMLLVVSIASGVTANFIYDALKNIFSNLGFQTKGEENYEANFDNGNDIIYIRKTEIKETIIISGIKK